MLCLWASQPVIYSTESQSFFDRLLTPPVKARKALYAALIDGLVVDGVWASLDVLYVCAAFDYGTALTNLVQTAYQATVYNSAGTAPSLTQDRGITGFGANGQILTLFNPSTASSPRYVQDDAMVCVWNRTTTQINARIVAQFDAGGQIEIVPRWSDGKAYHNLHGTEAGPSAGVDGSGFFLLQRTGASASALYRNDVPLGNNNTASSAPPNTQISFGMGAFEIAAMAIGKSLTAGQRTALYNRLQTYMTAVGA